MIKVLPALTLVLLLGSDAYLLAQGISRVNADLDKSKGQIVITYDMTISAGRYDKFKVEVYYSQDKGITFSEAPLAQVSGDVGNAITPGPNKKIYWNYFVENADFDGKNLVFKISAELDRQAEENRIIALGGPEKAISSVIVPGLGDYQVRSGKHYWVIGAATLSSIGTGLYLGRRANKNYSKYQHATTESAASRHFSRAKATAFLSDALLVAGATAWATDVALVIVKGLQNKKAKKAILSRKNTPVSQLYYDPALKCFVVFKSFRL